MAKSSATSKGILYIVATPIGNLEDLSARAIRILTEVDEILAEDTRHSFQLLQALGIKKPMSSFHAHNEQEKTQSVICALEEGKRIALISDAGTPLISDPGFPLVRLAKERNISVSPIPGPCAFITALSAAGVPCDSFTFIGFLPAKSSARQNRLLELSKQEQTLILYESTHRILQTVEDIDEIYGSSHQWVLAKELTKTFEHIIYQTTDKIIEWLQEDNAHQKGEFVLIIPPKVSLKQSNEEEILTILLKEVSLKQAVKITSLITKIPKNKIYEVALSLEKQ